MMATNVVTLGRYEEPYCSAAFPFGYVDHLQGSRTHRVANLAGAERRSGGQAGQIHVADAVAEISVAGGLP